MVVTPDKFGGVTAESLTPKVRRRRLSLIKRSSMWVIGNVEHLFDWMMLLQQAPIFNILHLFNSQSFQLPSD